MTYKKVFCLILAFVLVFSFAGCSGKKAVPYGTGTLKGGIYYNEWSDLGFAAPDGYVASSAGNLKEHEDECFYFIKDNGKADVKFTVLTPDFDWTSGSFLSLSEKPEDAEALATAAKNAFKFSVEKSNGAADGLKTEIKEIEICGKTFSAFEMNYNGSDGCERYIAAYYMLNNSVLCISLTANDINTVNDLDLLLKAFIPCAEAKEKAKDAVEYTTLKDIKGTGDFSAGTVEGDTYTNTWAGLKFTLPEGFEFSDAHSDTPGEYIAFSASDESAVVSLQLYTKEYDWTAGDYPLEAAPANAEELILILESLLEQTAGFASNISNTTIGGKLTASIDYTIETEEAFVAVFTIDGVFAELLVSADIQQNENAVADLLGAFEGI